MAIWDTHLQQLMQCLEAEDQAGIQHALDSILAIGNAAPAIEKLMDWVAPNASIENKSMVAEDIAAGNVTADELILGRTPHRWAVSEGVLLKTEKAMHWIAKISRRSSETEYVLARLLRDASDTMRGRATYVAGRLHYHEVVRAALLDASPLVRRIAVRAMWPKMSEAPLDAWRVLTQMLRDPDCDVCAEAAIRLADSDTKSEEARAEVRTALQRVLDAPRTSAACRAIHALAEAERKMGASGGLAANALVEILQNPSVPYDMKQEALRSLWEMGSRARESADAIRSVVQSDEALRAFGEDVLRKIGGD